MPAPTRTDLTYLRKFLDETAESCNQRVGDRLAVLLTTRSDANLGLLPPQETVDSLASIFRLPQIVGAATGVVPAD